MAHPLTEAHIEAQKRLRSVVSNAVAGVWGGLPNYDEESVEPFLSVVVPLVLGGQRQSVGLTNAYIARFVGRDPWPLDVASLIGAGVRNGTPPREVYRRPFVTVWTALKNGTPWEGAVAAGLDRATASAEMDIQLSMRETSRAVVNAD